MSGEFKSFISTKKGIALTVILLSLIGSGGYTIYDFYQKNENLKSELSTLHNSFLELEGELANSEQLVQQISTENDILNESLNNEKAIVSNQENKLDDYAGKIDTLEKLTTLDPELIKKYSKVFFLNEHYSPPELAKIDEEYISNPDKPQEIHEDVWPFLKKLLTRAERDGIDLRILSAYRSFGTQASLKSNYTITYGAGTANQFSADQGYSEHQLGTTVDFTTPILGADLNNFDKSEAYIWLLENAHKYGFVLSYPKNNTYYTFEPWHWRFVGRQLADHIYDEETYFYDLDQREIDEYLIYLFD